MRSDSRSSSPLALRMLSRLLRGPRRDALIGDLTEEYRRGRSQTWCGRQALWAIAADWRERPPKWFSVGTLRLSIIACVIVGASLHATWPFFLLILDPTWLLLLRRYPRHQRAPREPEPCAPSDRP